MDRVEVGDEGGKEIGEGYGGNNGGKWEVWEEDGDNCRLGEDILGRGDIF